MASRYTTMLALIVAILAAHAAAAGAKRGLQQSACNNIAIPTEKVHAHNDYDHEHPLLDALREGICSIEVDFYLTSEGELLVAHDWPATAPNKTMASLYLEPLAQIVTDNGGMVYPTSEFFGVCKSIILLADTKTNDGPPNPNPEYPAEAYFDALQQELQMYQDEYPGLFTTWVNGSRIEGAVSVYMSGFRPEGSYLEGMDYRVAALDGRLVNLDNQYDNTIYPLVSQGWCCDGGDDVLPEGADPLNLPADQLAYVQGLVKAAHDQGRIIRFWRTVDDAATWEFQFGIGADLVNTDTLTAINDWIYSRAATTATENTPYAGMAPSSTF